MRHQAALLALRNKPKRPQHFVNASVAGALPSKAPALYDDAESRDSPCVLTQPSPMRFLVLTTLYPNAAMPSHGIFVENRLRAFLKRHDAEVRVIAPVPWFPFQHETFGKYAAWARVPKRESRHGVEIYHPRYLLPPKVGMHYAPTALARCFSKAIDAITGNGWDFDFIDAHYFYPDGVAATAIAKERGKPIAITARGSDVSFFPDYPGPRKKIIQAATDADVVITVADALKTNLNSLGAPQQKITTLRNGVDLEIFAPRDRAAIRREMGLSGSVILSAGHLIERKGHHLVIEALKKLPAATLLIVGDGEDRPTLVRQVKAANLDARVQFLGALAPEKMPDIYNAADILVLASSREGWANVLLEAMACGTPCVATNVGGNPEVIREPAAGRLVGDLTSDAIAKAVSTLLSNPPDRQSTRGYAETHSWNETADQMAAIFSGLSRRARAAASITTAPISFAEPYRPKLIITVDTEEAFNWSDFETSAHSVCEPADLNIFQKTCDNAGAKPLYLVTYPLLKYAGTASYFRSLKDNDAADFGLHLHQWVTPPETRFSEEYFSYQKNLPQDIHVKKLRALADMFETVFGDHAIAHRAGRYGISSADYALLAEIGVRFDFSPGAAFDFSSTGGPDFSGYANHPFIVKGATAPVYVTPVSAAKTIRGTKLFQSQEGNSPGFSTTANTPSWKIPIRLSPEGANLQTLKALTKRLIADKTPVLTFTLHSTSLTKGANSYAPDADGVDHILSVTRDYLSWFRENIDGELVSLGDLATLYENTAKACAT